MTQVNLSRLLSELADTASVLNRESDTINDIIERFEESLRKLNVGLGVSVLIPSLDEVRLSWQKICATKKDGQLEVDWHLAIGNSALSEQTRDCRIAALEAFPEVVSELKREAEDRIARIEKAKKIVAAKPPVRLVPFRPTSDFADLANEVMRDKKNK